MASLPYLSALASFQWGGADYMSKINQVWDGECVLVGECSDTITLAKATIWFLCAEDSIGVVKTALAYV
jgi:hypothetical protein